MAFDQLIPRSFNLRTINQFAPRESGVFGLSNARAWLFIGSSEDVQQSLLALLAQAQTSPSEEQATGFIFETCPAAHRQNRQQRLIGDYRPAWNQPGARRRD